MHPVANAIPEDVQKTLDFLNQSGTGGQGGLESYIDAISKPGNWFHLRLNTLKASRDEVIERVAREATGWRIEPETMLPEAIKVAVSGPFQVEPVDRYVVVDKATGEAVATGAPLFAPGFKHAASRFDAGDRVTMVIKPKQQSLKMNRSIAPLYVCGNGIARYPSSNIHEIRAGIVVQTTESWYRTPSVHEWDAYASGILFDQNLPSMVASRVLAPVAGETVLDVCSGTGGKTTHLAQLMQDQGRVIAVDRSPAKIARLEERAKRMGFSCIAPVATKTEHMRLRVGELEPGAILIDPPCSALGLRMKLYTTITRKDILDFQANQLRIWRHVEPYIMQGTRIVYCTCTVTTEENETVIAHVADKLDLEIEDARARLSEFQGSEAISGGITAGTVSKSEARKFLRFYPHTNGTIGFFISLLKKK